jgi:Fe-S cluster assembly protein SufD
MSAALSERLAQEHASVPNEALSPHVVSADRRRAAVEALAGAGLPTTRDENWKYANLRPLEKVKFAPSPPRVRTDIRADELPAGIEGYARYTFVDGVFVPELSRATTVAGIGVAALRAGRVGSAAVSVASPDSTSKDASRVPTADRGMANLDIANRGKAAADRDVAPLATRAAHAQGAASVPAASSGAGMTHSADERFALLNEAFATDGAVIEVGAGVDCPGCVELLFVATESSQTAASYPRVQINVAENARLGLIERHISLHDDANFVNGAVKVNIARGAEVNHYRLQQAGARSTWFDTLSATVDEGARYCLHHVDLGALSARSTMHIQLTGARAELALHVVSLGEQQQTHDGFALVEHIAPYTKSEHTVRGIAGGRSRVAFNSKVVVREHAKGTDSRQSLRGLLAGTQAEIDVRPQLEIYTDDVKCNHGATAGKLDDNMLFYLLSRGIDRDTAQQLLKWAFLEDVVARIAVPELRKHIEASLAGQMKETAALKELI